MIQNWKILIVTNNTIIEEYYQNDQKFNNKNWSFFNVGKTKLTSDKFDIINSCDIPNYRYLGKEWAESEVIYNISKLNMFKEYDFLGIIHWDFNLYAKDHDTYRITENISNILEKYNVISFFPGFMKHITGFYDVLMDERKPNCLFVRKSGLENPKSSLDFCSQIIETENAKKWKEIKDDKIIPLCCSFICKRNEFIKIGNMIQKCVDGDYFNKFDTEKRHRIQGQIMERMIALNFVSQDDKIFPFRLDHKFTGGMEINKNDPNGEDY